MGNFLHASVPGADRSHSLKKLQNLKNKHTSRGMKWKARAKKNSMKEKDIIEKGEKQSKGKTHPK